MLIGLVVATVFYLREREARDEVEKREQRLVEANYAKDMQAVAYAFDRGRNSLARSILENTFPSLVKHGSA